MAKTGSSVFTTPHRQVFSSEIGDTGYRSRLRCPLPIWPSWPTHGAKTGGCLRYQGAFSFETGGSAAADWVSAAHEFSAAAAQTYGAVSQIAGLLVNIVFA
jgi:hypothetical protein